MTQDVMMALLVNGGGVFPHAYADAAAARVVEKSGSAVLQYALGRWWC
jgi:hypothetical protein